jgi:hypothetical protein
MDDPTGEAGGSGLRVAFDRRLKLEFHGATVTSDAGLLAFRELDDALGLTALAGDTLRDPRTGKNGRHTLLAQFRQAVFGRLAGYEDVNDADRLARDPAMRWVVGDRAVTEHAASTSQMGRYETAAMTTATNLTALADLSGQWIDRVQARRARTTLVLDIDSSVSPTYGAQEGTAYNGHFACTCYHPLFVFNRTATWSSVRSGPATCTVRMAGARYSTPWSHAIGARPSGAYYAAMRPSPCPTCTSTSKPRASSTRSACPQTRCCKIRSRRSSPAPSGAPRTMSDASMRASAIGRRAGAGRVGWSRRSSGIPVSCTRALASS